MGQVSASQKLSMRSDKSPAAVALETATSSRPPFPYEVMSSPQIAVNISQAVLSKFIQPVMQ
ncbi:hypothetical protein ACO22_06495 [Paracoccidioides brasiliensis]|uniref:Uncharacterized protein n=1 Tax=Paracoccidioides brasiliensis TaxID=121759 RepID=A0A1D2J7D4_PARBR|nr:hypothetical protein ACO22_06495 [Paracoccidioides brasiliensis]ODH46752.1 hypothetical protein GX48_07152 [Paracoccidioides brasiliensis]